VPGEGNPGKRYGVRNEELASAELGNINDDELPCNL
jgi:hypothetical protein